MFIAYKNPPNYESPNQGDWKPAEPSPVAYGVKTKILWHLWSQSRHEAAHRATSCMDK